MNVYYKFKFYLNARHSVNINGRQSNIHPHTWEISIAIKHLEEDVLNFSLFEKDIEEYFENFEGKYLNETDKFFALEPTMESLGISFYKDLKSLVEKKKLKLLELEINENPTRKFIINGVVETS